MLKKRYCFLFSLLCAVFLSGCGLSGSESSSLSAPEARSDHGAIPLELPQGEVPEETVVEYTWDHPVTVDGNRRLTVRLRCEAEYRGASWYYSVKSMDLLEGETLLQTMSIEQADAAACAQEGIASDYANKQTQCLEPDGGLFLEDLNFDGLPDLRLLLLTGIVNSRYLCWLWNPEQQTFDYAFCLVGYDVQIDTEAEQIITIARDAMTHITNCYEYDKNGVLQLVHTDSVTPGMG